jgi:hypothetical protein
VPTDKIELSEKAVSAIASSAERFIGYVYAGIVPFCVVAIENGRFVKQITESLGGVLTAITAFVVGIGIYTIYVRVLGELLIFPLQHFLHHMADRLLRKSDDQSSSPVWLVHHWGVPLKHSRGAYHKIRNHFFTGQDQVEIQVSHGELHVLYLTAISGLAVYFLMQNLGQSPSPFYLIISAIVYVAALVADTRQHAIEAASMRTKVEDIRSFLYAEGLAFDHRKDR